MTADELDAWINAILVDKTRKVCYNIVGNKMKRGAKHGR